ncbi:replication region DNA-binding N-term [Azotobacter beijerinckii]|uniref:Replication region DNA-binding N-term n=1 Tax=Azotobacter beijerinckii TaxID=170623 RepID=A0A1H6ZJ10_9GAMM|nr:DNA-binding protein [Azotobacter beijerinckii]SEJ53268.1 replication region DNA-binding N-term [Azotobacter beijerinckii]
MRPAEYAPDTIIQAGEALQAAGRNVTGFALRQKVGGGNPNRLKQVWEEHLARSAVAEAEPVAELPVEVAEELAAVAKALTERLTALAVELNDKAVKAAERRVREIVKAAGEQRELAERELADAAQTVEDLEQQLDGARGELMASRDQLAEGLAQRQSQAVELAQMRERVDAAEKVAKEAARAATQREADLLGQLQQARQAEQAAREREATANGQLLAAMQQHEENTQLSAELRRDLEKARKEAEDGRVHLQAAQARLDGAAREIEEARKQAREARDEAKQAAASAAERRGELKVLQQEIARLKDGKTSSQPHKDKGRH